MNYNPSLNIGDVLSRPKALGFLQHIGVVVGPNAVCHNTPTKGEHISTLAEFGAGQKITVRRTGTDPWPLLGRVQRILSNPKKYDLATRNCEHTVSEAVAGTPKSQTAALLWFIALIAVLYFICRGR